jgi:hypothetical protein
VDARETVPKQRRLERADRPDVLEHPRAPRPHLGVVAPLASTK